MPSIATINGEGELVIPESILQVLGVTPGTRVSLSVKEDQIILRPITAKFVDSLRGRFAGGPSMTDELIAERRAEDKKW
jgi:bifunctional DNA-binding transcriptional regulator/antitoxin component of YhaV-PrlF toxin-antitoxin module